MEVYIVRHGESEANARGVLAGQSDSPLTERGRQQARETTKFLPDKVDFIITSPLLRCKETAEIIAEKYELEIIFDERLKERDFGKLTGRRWKDVVNEHGSILSNNERNLDYDYTHFDGENKEMVFARVGESLEDMSNLGFNCGVVVTHNGVIRIIYKKLDNKNFNSSQNAEVHIFNI